VAIGTIPAYVGEDRFDVALHAFHFFVHATQGISRFAVIKLWNGTDGAPTGRGVAVFARNSEWAVRVASGVLLGIACRIGGRGGSSRRTAGGRKSE
jgi:hypothetical protein